MSDISFPYSNVSRLMKEASGLRVSRPAVESLRDELVRYVGVVARASAQVAREDGRSTISGKHLAAALRAMAQSSGVQSPEGSAGEV